MNMCTQTIFSLLDHLTTWVSARREDCAVKTTKGLTNEYSGKNRLYLSNYYCGI